MSTYTRGEFLGFAALLAGAARLKPLNVATTPAPSPDQARSPGIEADLVVVNAVVHTVDGAQPRAEALAVKDGRFLAVGSSADIRNLASTRTRVIDAQRMTVVPGFIDTHCHPSGVNELFEVNANVRTVAELQANLRKKASSTPAGFWVSGHMFDDTKLDRPLTRQDLDAVSTSHPIVVNHRGGHTSWYNTTALQLADITPSTPDPAHGRFFRDASGALTGRVAEQARGVFGRVGRRTSHTPEEQRDRGRQGMRHISELLTAAGLTTVHDAGAGADRIRTYEDVYHSGDLRHRAYLMVRGAYEQLRNAGVYTGLGNDWVRIGGVKYGADGSASERTMRMSTPYVGTNDFGILTMTQEEIHQRVEDAHRNNWQIGIHANGDVTIDMVLQAYERVLKAVAASRSAPSHRALLARQSVAVAAHQGDRHGADAVLDLRVLPRRKVVGVRRRQDALDVRAPVLPRHRHRRARGIGLRSRPVRAAHGDPEHGHAQGLSRPRVGHESEGHRGRGAEDRDHQWCVRLVRGERQRDRSRPASWPTS